MTKVIVSVVGIQKDVYGEENRIESVAVGRHYFKNGVNYISYQDNETAGMEGTNTLLKISDDCVTLVRKGQVEHTQVFKLSETNSSLYRTPYGDITLTIMTNNLDISFGTSTGTINIGYELVVDGQWQSANKLHIKICNDNNVCSAVN